MEYTSNDEMNLDRNEYPDPDYTPRFPWLGVSETGPSQQDSVVHAYSTETLNDQYSGTDEYFREEKILSDQGEGRDANDASVDPDFQYDDESEQSDLSISEADSDFDAPNLIEPESRHRGKRTSRGKGGRFGAGPGFTQGRRGRGRGRERGGLGRGAKGVKRGIRKPLEPSEEFKRLHSLATVAFLDQEYSTAEEYAKEAIKENSEIFTIYSLLSEIHMALGDKTRAMHALFNGAHTRPCDDMLWCKVAEMIMEVAGDDRESAIADAIYCYNRVIGTVRDNVEARYGRAALNREAGNRKRAAYDYERLLQILPHDTCVLRHLAEIYIELGESKRAIQHYDESIAHYQSLHPNGRSGFTWSDLNIYAELFINFTESVEVEAALLKVKGACRWLQGRNNEGFWNDYDEDDREFDASSGPRRSNVPEFIAGRHAQSTYGEDLPLEIRIKLGLFRLNLGEDHLEEAKAHFEWLQPETDGHNGKISDFPDLFREVADAFRLHSRWDEALRYYDPLQLVEDYLNPSYFSDMATCYSALAMYDEAEDCIRVLIDNDGDNMAALVQMATMFDTAELPDRAAPYVDQIIILRRRRALHEKQGRLAKKAAPLLPVEGSAESAKKPAPLLPVEGPAESIPMSGMLERTPARKSTRRHAVKPNQDSHFEERIRLKYIETRQWKERYKLGEIDAKVHWMEGAKFLLDAFKSNRRFFPPDRNYKAKGWSGDLRRGKAKASQQAEELSKVTGRLKHLLTEIEEEEGLVHKAYCEIEFAQWLDIFLEYAMHLAEDGRIAISYEYITATLGAPAFISSRDSMLLIHVVWFTCALMANDDETLCKVARYFMKAYQFVTDSYRLFAALNRLCDRPNRWYNSNPSLKHMLRQIKAVDFSLIGEERRKPLYEERAKYTTIDEAGNSITPKEMNVALLMLYGHMMSFGASYAYALNYFYRAYALEPQNPMVSLSLALGYIHHSFKRQSESRHYLIMQGFSFLFSYYDLRKQSRVPAERQECEFNVARAYHMLGLTNLAIPYYKQCLVISEEAQQDNGEVAAENFAADAALALQGIWAVSGEMLLAQEVTEKWLVL